MDTMASGGLSARRRRALFRAWHRGTRENDLLLGGFVERRIETLDEAELAALERLLEMPDPLLSDWLMGRLDCPEGEEYALLREIREAVRSGQLAR